MNSCHCVSSCLGSEMAICSQWNFLCLVWLASVLGSFQACFEGCLFSVGKRTFFCDQNVWLVWKNIPGLRSPNTLWNLNYFLISVLFLWWMLVGVAPFFSNVFFFVFPQAPKGETLAKCYQRKLWYSCLLPQMARSPGREQIPNGTEEPVRLGYSGSISSPVRHQRLVHSAVWAHYTVAPNVQRGCQPRRWLLNSKPPQHLYTLGFVGTYYTRINLQHIVCFNSGLM